MNRIIAFLAVTGAVLAPVATSSARKPPKPPGQQAVTLKSSVPRIVFGQTVTSTTSVKGVKAGVGVTLQRRPVVSQTWSDVETKLTDQKGDASFTTKPRANTAYRAIARTTPEQTSAESVVLVAPLIGFRVSDSTPAAGARVRFAGTVRPRHNGRRVRIQRKRADGSFVTVKRARLRARTAGSSRYRTRVRVRRSGTYRVVLPAHADHAAGVSAERTLTTTG